MTIKKVSATKARVNFGEVVDRVGPDAPVAVEHRGETDAVVINLEDYDDLRTVEPEAPDWWDMLMETRRRFRQELGDKDIDVDELIRTMREERTEELLDGLC